MVDFENIRETVVKGLKQYLNCPVIKSNQAAEPPPYPYVSYTVTTPIGHNRGTHGEYDDGVARKPVTHTWSITVQSDDDIECMTLANKAHDWLDYVGTTYLSDNKVTVQSVTDVQNRDNFLTADYEYKKGFDCFFNCFDEIRSNYETGEYIEEVNIDGEEIRMPRTDEELINQLGERLSGR